MSGPGWKNEQIKVTGNRRKVTTEQFQRDQEKFRKLLLAKDQCCAVTDEKFPVVLEAAHIVSVKDGGQDVLSNGILLRADLHRLYDANPPGFRIDLLRKSDFECGPRGTGAGVGNGFKTPSAD